MLHVEHVDAVDQSDFEGANIVADLSAEIPSDLKGKYDLIINGSVLDNIWDTGHAMRNIASLQSETGRLMEPHGRSTVPIALG